VQSRRFGGALELFTAADWIWNQRFESSELLQLQEAQALRSHEGIRLDFQKMAMASLFSELMVKLHANALAALEEGVFSPTPPIALLNGYLAKLLQWSGNQPRFQHCLDCGKTLQSYWEAGSSQVAVLTMVVQAGGWICSECRIQGLTHIQERSEIQGIEILEVGTDAMADCLMSLVTPIRQVPLTAHASDSAHRSLFRVLEAFLVFHLPGFDRLPLKSLQFLRL
jgi:recombinational DNA repair protein (RecF pathway)